MPHKSASSSFKYFQQLFDRNSKIFFAYHVESNQFSYINSAFEKVWDLPLEKALSNPVTLLEGLHPADKGFIIDSYKALLQGKEKEEVEFRLQLNDGTIRW